MNLTVARRTKKHGHKKLDAILRAYQTGLMSGGQALVAMRQALGQKKGHNREPLYSLIRQPLEGEIL
jgi:hypothetical protein